MSEKAKPLMVLRARYNRKNYSSCELFSDHLLLTTVCESRWMAVYENREREILFQDIERVVISSGGLGFFAKHPNAVHFIHKGSKRTLDEMLRDPKFTSADYILEGVQQFCPESQEELTEKIALASKMKDYIEHWQEEHRKEDEHDR